MDVPEKFSERDAVRLSETWLGTVFGRGLIDREQYEAGVQFQGATWRAFGRPFAPAQGGTHGGDEAERDGAQRFALRCKQVLAACSRQTRDDVVNLCQYDRRPSLRPAEVAHIREGLDALADMIGLKRVA